MTSTTPAATRSDRTGPSPRARDLIFAARNQPRSVTAPCRRWGRTMPAHAQFAVCPDVPSLPILRARCRTPELDLADDPRTNDQEARPRPRRSGLWPSTSGSGGGMNPRPLGYEPSRPSSTLLSITWHVPSKTGCVRTPPNASDYAGHCSEMSTGRYQLRPEVI